MEQKQRQMFQFCNLKYTAHDALKQTLPQLLLSVNLCIYLLAYLFSHANLHKRLMSLGRARKS